VKRQLLCSIKRFGNEAVNPSMRFLNGTGNISNFLSLPLLCVACFDRDFKEDELWS
jgi:hypothetical protein